MNAPFLPLFKAEQATQTVWARAAAEEPDKAREIMDYISAKPQFEEWSGKFKEATLGKSLGNVRAMHNPRHLAGKITDIVYNDDAKSIDVCVKVLDPTDWKKLEEGGYTGLSIGGGYLKKWADPLHKGHIRYTPKISEISLVDSPCIPSARFMEIQKRDGSIEEIPLVGHARTFSEIMPPPTFADLRKAAPSAERLAALEDRMEKANFSGVAARAAGLARLGAGKVARGYLHVEDAAADKVMGHALRRHGGMFGPQGAKAAGAAMRRAYYTRMGMRAGTAAGGAAALGGGAYAATRRRAEKQDPVLAALEDRMEKVAWGEVAEGLRAFGHRAATTAQTYGGKALNTRPGQAVAQAGHRVGHGAARAAVGYMKLSARSAKDGARIGGHIGERIGRVGGNADAGREWGQAVGAGMGAHAPLAAAGYAAGTLRNALKPSDDQLKKPTYMQKSIEAQLEPITQVAPVVFIPPGSKAGPGKTVDEARLKRETDPRSRHLALPRYMTKSAPEQLLGQLEALNTCAVTDPKLEKLFGRDKTAQVNDTGRVDTTHRPAAGSERGGGGTGWPLSDKAHTQRIAAAKARWLKEGHHDVDQHFDQQRATAAKALLGRDRKVAEADTHRAGFWHEVANTQDAYDKVRRHLPKDANLMMEVSHAHGLLYNPEGVGEGHFDDHGRPKQPLYHLDPTEADDWIHKWGKGVSKAAPSNLVAHIRDLGEATVYASGAFHQLAV